MRIKHLIVTSAAAALLIVPAGAFAAAGDNPGASHRSANAGGTKTPGPKASTKAKGKAYGRYCQGQSKKHVAGQKGTPFSQCVTAMAKLATGKVENPTTACKALSKKHVAGEKGTPFSRCVSGAAKLLHDRDDSADDTSDDSSSTTTDDPATTTTS